MKLRVHLIALSLSLLLAPRGVFASQAVPLDQAEILGRLAMGYPPSYIAHLVKTRGVSFSATPDFLVAVKLAGGDGILTERLSSAKSPFNETDESVEHFGRCAELIHTGDIEFAEEECRDSIGEDPKSPWPLLVNAKLIPSDQSEDNPSSADQDQKAKRLELVQRAIALAPDLAATREAAAIFEGRPLSFSDVQGTPPLDDVQLEVGLDIWGSQGYVWPYAAGSHSPAKDFGPTSDQSITIDSLTIERIRMEPDLASNHLVLANDYDDQVHNFEMAEYELREALRLEPDNADLHTRLALLYHDYRNKEAALTELREAARIVPYGSHQHIAVATELEALGRTADAIAELQTAINLRPTDEDVSDSLIDLYLSRKDANSAIQELRRSLKASSAMFSDEAKLVEARYNDERRLAELLQDNHDLDASAEQYLLLLRIYPDDSGLHNDYGTVLADQHRIDEAISEYDEAIGLDPRNPSPHHNIGLCLTQRKELDGAISEFRQALEINPDNPHTEIYLGAALAQNGDLHAAMDRLQQAIEKSPKDPEAHATLGYALIQMRDTPGAIKELKAALEIQPDSPLAENNLAWLYATAENTKFRNPSEALVLARKAVESSATPNPAFLDTLAEALLLNGKPAEALAAENQAIKLDPQDADLQSRLPRFRDAASKLTARKP
ncbi:MAG TPA: tetratricopeptide repeat protein [Candidatus Acidoferrales bacterium]|nr:tetratricopeptide repeat protein [Candidatus Acidoferrales bacterium]